MFTTFPYRDYESDSQASGKKEKSIVEYYLRVVLLYDPVKSDPHISSRAVSTFEWKIYIHAVCDSMWKTKWYPIAICVMRHSPGNEHVSVTCMHVRKWCRSVTLHLTACKHDRRDCEAMRSILIVRTICFFFWRLIAAVWIARFLYACWRRVLSSCSWLKSLLILWEPENGRLWSYKILRSAPE